LRESEINLQGNRILLRHLPPTTVGVKPNDIWRGISANFDGQNAIEEFRSILMKQIGSSNCFLTSSGRAGLAIILLGLKRLSKRKKVIVPAYVCPTVVQSVLRADLEPVFCDVSPQTLDLDRDALMHLIDDDLLAVVPAHLYGWAQDVSDLIALGRQHGFYIIEDAAQAYGAKFDGKMVGTRGDAGYYSMGRGKCIPVSHGGVIVAKESCLQAISDVIESEAISPIKVDITAVPIYMAYGLATHPMGWWLISRTPWNPADTGMDIGELEPISLRGLSCTLAGIGASVLERINQNQAVARKNAQRLIASFAEFNIVTVPHIAPESDPVFLRLPFVVKNEAIADSLFSELSRIGIGVSRSYWRTIPDLFSKEISSEAREFPGASRLAKCLLTLPTHRYLREDDFENIVRVIQAIQNRIN
jgi:dTDP-4-amino-4,6-dideoxygalactose transaminase